MFIDISFTILMEFILPKIYTFIGVHTGHHKEYTGTLNSEIQSFISFQSVDYFCTICTKKSQFQTVPTIDITSFKLVISMVSTNK